MQIDLQTLLSEQIQKMIEDGSFNKIIEKETTEMVRSTCQRLFSSYGDIAKQIENQIKENICLDLSKTNFAEYNHNLSVLVKNTIEKALTEYGIEKSKKMMDEILLEQVPEKIKISELVDKFKEDLDDEEQGHNITFITSDSHGFTHVGFDKEEGKREYLCDIRLMINNNKICNVHLDRKELKSNMILGGLYGFEGELFKLYSRGTFIEMDLDEVDTYIHENES